MQTISDHFRQTVVQSSTVKWVDSPLAGVGRKLLERSGHEVARTTPIVRYARTSTSARHARDRGEGLFVLGGVFARPDRTQGCTIMLKTGKLLLAEAAGKAG